MKVTFLMPPALDGTSTADRCFGCNYGIYPLPHLPSLIVATLLRNHGFEVDLHDFAAKKETLADFSRFVQQDNSKIYVFFSVFLSGKTDLLAREMIRKVNCDARFIFCGTQPTSNPEQFLDSEDSFIVRGEPEFPTLQLVQALNSHNDFTDIKGISYLKDGTIIKNGPADLISDLDTLPVPDRTLLDHRPYYNPKLTRLPHTAILTSRGCFGKCWYCVPNSLSFARELEFKHYCGKKPIPRLHSVERVIQEFKTIHDQGFQSVTVLDDEFLWNEGRTVAICTGIKDLHLEWLCLARPDMITERSVEVMAAAGCRYIDLGIESFNQDILDAVGKDITVEQARGAIAIIKKYGIEPKVNILFGASPLETEETIRQTVDMAESLNVRYVLYNIAAPFPGTEFYKAARDHHWFVTPDNDYRPLDPTAEAIISYPHLSKERMEHLLSYAYRRHYFNPRYMIDQVCEITSLSDLKHKLEAAAGIFHRRVR
jgi:anaerobic magnesium-protoporphyrin IX monomethyl ester cyclase